MNWTPVAVAIMTFGAAAWGQPVADVPAPEAKPPPTPEAALTTTPPARRVARVGLELALGVASGATSGLVAAYAGLNVDLLSGREAGVGFGLGGAAGVALAVGPGVWLAGHAMGGDGSLGWTLLAGALGTGASAALLAVNDKPAMLVVAATVPVAGAILGYELSSESRRAPARSSLTLLPVLGPAQVGVVGTF
jgi:hypothetical protein